MKLTPATAADTIITWMERFELNELRIEKQIQLADTVLLAVCHRVDRGCPRGMWSRSLWECQKVLDRATTGTGPRPREDEESSAYNRAVANVYAGTVDLACGNAQAALDHFRCSAEIFGDLGRHRAKCIAWAAVGLTHARHEKLADVLEAFEESLEAIDEIESPSPSIKELRRQIMRIVQETLNPHE